jgi:SP family galactose:H+ symporter-like MFS transporter
MTVAQTPRTHHAILRLSTIAASGGLLFGFNTAVISGALPMITQAWQLDPALARIVVSAVLVGAIFGALCAGPIADALGRRDIIMANAATFALGAFISGLAPSIEWLVAGRVMIGIAVGAVSVCVPLYIAEIAPAKTRGALVTLNQLAITVGILMAFVAGTILDDYEGGWRYMFMSGSALAVLFGMAMLFLVESPRWLVWQDDEQEARRILNDFGIDDVDREIAAMKASLKTETGLTWRDFGGPRIRPAMATGIGLYFFQQFVGINAILYFAPTIFDRAGFDTSTAGLLAAVAIGIVNVIGSIIAIQLIDRIGRKPLLSVGFIGMTISLLVVGLVFFITGGPGPVQKWLVLAALLSFIGFFAISIGPAGWLMISEIYPTTVRGRAMAIPSAAHWTFNLIVSFLFIGFLHEFGHRATYWIFALFGAVGWFFCRYYVPETAGRSLEDIQASYVSAADKPAAYGASVGNTPVARQG